MRVRLKKKEDSRRGVARRGGVTNEIEGEPCTAVLDGSRCDSVPRYNDRSSINENSRIFQQNIKIIRRFFETDCYGFLRSFGSIRI